MQLKQVWLGFYPTKLFKSFLSLTKSISLVILFTLNTFYINLKKIVINTSVDKNKNYFKK